MIEGLDYSGFLTTNIRSMSHKNFDKTTQVSTVCLISVVIHTIVRHADGGWGKSECYVCGKTVENLVVYAA